MKSLLVAILLAPFIIISEGRGAAPALASPIYQLMTHSPVVRQEVKGIIAAFQIRSGFPMMPRSYIALLYAERRYELAWFEFRPGESDSDLMTSEFFELARMRRIEINRDDGITLHGVLTELADSKRIRSDMNSDAQRYVSVALVYRGGIEYVDNQVGRYLPLLDNIVDCIAREGRATDIGRTLNTFFDPSKRGPSHEGQAAKS